MSKFYQWSCTSIYIFLIAQFYTLFTSWLFSENNYFPVLREISNYILCVSTFIYVSSECVVNMGRKSLNYINYVSFVVGCMCGCVVAFKRWYCLLTFLCIILQDDTFHYSFCKSIRLSNLNFSLNWVGSGHKFDWT